MCSTLVSLLDRKIFSVSREPTLAGTNCLHRIRSSLFANIFSPPSLLLTSYYRYHRSGAFAPISGSSRNRTQSAVKTTRLRPGVLDMCGSLRQE